MSNGFIKLMRSDAMLELTKTPNAFTLLAVIAYRARRHEGYNKHKLQPGEALIGDYKNYGLTCQNYRTAKKLLFSTGKVTFKTTNRGTIAKLVDNSLYDINIESQKPTRQQAGQQAANTQPTGSQPLTKNVRKKEGKKTTGFSNSSFKPTLLPITGKNCKCGMPAVYKKPGTAYDTFLCIEHLPDKVKAMYGVAEQQGR